ncbi:MAG: hypothetical protein DYH03_11460 [Nitrospira sp. NTP1]|nr:hypothetical protein [Nitrospira sp. NTP1]
MLDFFRFNVPTAVCPFGALRTRAVGLVNMGAVPLFWARTATASVDDCCSRLSVVSAAAAVGGKAEEHSAEDKQPATPITSTLLGVFMMVPPEFRDAG